MHKYGRLLMNQWKIANPKMVEELDDPEGYFAAMGDRAADQVLEVEGQILSRDETYRTSDSYLDRIRVARSARMQAEEIVLSQYRPPSSMEPEENEDDYV